MPLIRATSISFVDHFNDRLIFQSMYLLLVVRLWNKFTSCNLFWPNTWRIQTLAGVKGLKSSFQPSLCFGQSARRRLFTRNAITNLVKDFLTPGSSATLFAILNIHPGLFGLNGLTGNNNKREPCDREGEEEVMHSCGQPTRVCSMFPARTLPPLEMLQCSSYKTLRRS